MKKCPGLFLPLGLRSCKLWLCAVHLHAEAILSSVRGVGVRQLANFIAGVPYLSFITSSHLKIFVRGILNFKKLR